MGDVTGMGVGSGEDLYVASAAYNSILKYQFDEKSGASSCIGYE